MVGSDEERAQVEGAGRYNRGVFDFLKRQRRERITAEPFPEAWEEYLRANVAHYALLTPDEQARLRDDLRVFRAEREWEGAGGLSLTDEVTVTISALACLLTLGLPNRTDAYRGVSTILVYPAGYRVAGREPMPGGIVDVRESWRLGEAWQHGPVILSWADARDGARQTGDGHSVALHEFAHALDMADGDAEGVPRLHRAELYDAWQQVMDAEFNALREETYAGREAVLDSYGATNPAEFFAVATETFFEKPVALHHRHRLLYSVLRDYYGQDPAARTLRHLRSLPRAARKPAAEEIAAEPRKGRAWPWSEP